MFAPILSSAGRQESSPEGRPLGFPAELWAEMSAEHRSACTSAAALLDAFGGTRVASLRAVSERAGDDRATVNLLDGFADVDQGDLPAGVDHVVHFGQGRPPVNTAKPDVLGLPTLRHGRQGASVGVYRTFPLRSASSE